MPSKKAELIERTMRRLDLKRIMQLRVQSSARKNFHYEEPTPGFRMKYPVDIYKIDGCKCVYTSSAKENAKYHIMYFHGGSYTMPAMRTHWHIIDSILSRTKAELTFVNYPLSPEYKCDYTIQVAYKAYKNISENYNKSIIIMGDSSGGGLALALAQYVNEINYTVKPKKLVLLSPWLDVSMDNNISKSLEGRDLVLDIGALKKHGENYAGSLDTKNYMCSPLYGNLDNLGDVAVFIGTNDVLYAQCEIFRQKMKAMKYPLSYYEYIDMHHVWMGYPIPEAKEAFDQISEFIAQ